jgi:cellulose synthase/poly-beta-1,6-N-acetylglucosamine synthase-like glycosyltransferase
MFTSHKFLDTILVLPWSDFNIISRLYLETHMKWEIHDTTYSWQHFCYVYFDLFDMLTLRVCTNCTVINPLVNWRSSCMVVVMPAICRVHTGCLAFMLASWRLFELLMIQLTERWLDVAWSGMRVELNLSMNMVPVYRSLITWQPLVRKF